MSHRRGRVQVRDPLEGAAPTLTPRARPVDSFANPGTPAPIQDNSLADLGWRQPRVPLIDGRGKVWRRFQSDLQELRRYTLRTQVVEPFDFSCALRLAVREFNPDHLALLGPGEVLGGSMAQVLIGEGWRGLDSKSDFQMAQSGPQPVLAAMNRPRQARFLD